MLPERGSEAGHLGNGPVSSHFQIVLLGHVITASLEYCYDVLPASSLASLDHHGGQTGKTSDWTPCVRVISFIYPATCGPKGHCSTGIAFIGIPIFYPRGGVRQRAPSVLWINGEYAT